LIRPDARRLPRSALTSAAGQDDEDDEDDDEKTGAEPTGDPDVDAEFEQGKLKKQREP